MTVSMDSTHSRVSVGSRSVGSGRKVCTVELLRSCGKSIPGSESACVQGLRRGRPSPFAVKARVKTRTFGRVIDAGPMPLHKKILIALVAGALLGLLANTFAPGANWLALLVRYVTEPVGKIF